MKRFIFTLCIIGCFVACSSSDDSDGSQQQMPTETGEYSLTLNGSGLTDFRVEMYNDTINFIGLGNIFAASDDFGNAMSIVIPSQSDPAINTIVEFPDNPTHPSGQALNAGRFYMGNDVYHSENGVFELESFNVDFDANCGIWTGNLDINFSLNGEGTDMLNVQGTFEVFSEGCNE